MPHYLFHLSDGEDLFVDDEGNQLEDSGAAHLHALRIIENAHRQFPTQRTAGGRSGSRWQPDSRC